jgi:hypothetical protein
MDYIIEHLSDDSRLDQYSLEVVFKSAWEEALKPKLFAKGSLLRLIVLTSNPDLPETFTILDLSLAIKQLILAGSWYNPSNLHMIIWQEEYQHIHDRAISDVGDLQDLLLPLWWMTLTPWRSSLTSSLRSGSSWSRSWERNLPARNPLGSLLLLQWITKQNT